MPPSHLTEPAAAFSPSPHRRRPGPIQSGIAFGFFHKLHKLHWDRAKKQGMARAWEAAAQRATSHPPATRIPCRFSRFCPVLPSSATWNPAIPLTPPFLAPVGPRLALAEGRETSLDAHSPPIQDRRSGKLNRPSPLELTPPFRLFLAPTIVARIASHPRGERLSADAQRLATPRLPVLASS